MFLVRQILLMLSTLTSAFSFGQIPKHLFNEITEQTYSSKDFTSITKPIKQRVGVYHFGESEAESVDTFYDDKERYQFSINVQPDNYFKGKTKQELKIMRNTIYANYGLIFQAGGEMEKYFRKKDWYNPFLKDVSNCLTDIERKNIQTIARFEQL